MSHLGLSLAFNAEGIADLHFDANSSLAIVTDAHAVGQHVRQRLKTYHGEWFLDTEAGTPWLEQVLGKGYDPALAEAVIKKRILETHGVAEITALSTKYDRNIRQLTGFSITVLTTYDEEISL